MCLGVPGQIMNIQGEGLGRTGKVCFGGTVKDVNLSFLPDAKPGDYVIVHVGFALSQIDDTEAFKTLEYLSKSLVQSTSSRISLK